MRRLERHARGLGLRGPYTHLWLLRYYLYTYGHKTAYLILGAACFVSLAVVVHVQNNERHTAAALARLVKSIQVDRRHTLKSVCKAQNRVTLRLRGLIIQGAQQSRPFERLFRSYGLPPYHARIRQARRQARSLPALPCSEFVRRIRRATPPPPDLPH